MLQKIEINFANFTNKVINEKSKIAEFYSKNFKDLNNIFHLMSLAMPRDQAGICILLILKNKKIRNKVMKALKTNNIDTRLSFPPIHLNFIKKKFNENANRFKSTVDIFDKFLDIPCWPKMGKNLKKTE